jgi:hypothetical protein
MMYGQATRKRRGPSVALRFAFRKRCFSWIDTALALYEFPPLGAIGIWQAESELESDVFAALNERVFLEGIVLAIGKIGAIMAAAGLFAGQR